MFTLENDYLKIKINDVGAEVTKITGKKENTKFLWDGDEEFWSSHSPILFPIVGRLKNNEYFENGIKYDLKMHGFGRSTKFNLVEQNSTKIVFSTLYTEETLKQYPYKFRLIITHTLYENKLTTEFNVENLDKEAIYFGIGGHPGFMCPINPELKFEDYYLEFNHLENAYTLLVNKSGLIAMGRKDILVNEDILKLDYGLFKNDALIFKTLISNQVRLKTDKDNKYIEFDFTGFPILAIWTLEDGPFICFEPWFSHGDFENFNGQLRDKRGIIALPKEKQFTCNYSIKIFE